MKNKYLSNDERLDINSDLIHVASKIEQMGYIKKFQSFNDSLNDYKRFREFYKREPTQREMLWVMTQKNKFKNNKLSQEKINAILNINPNFFDRKKTSKSFEENLQNYIEFRNKNKREPVQKDMNWCHQMRNDFKKGKLSQEKINAILNINPNFFENNHSRTELKRNREKGDFLYVPNYNDCIIYKFPTNVERKEIWEYFDSFKEAKENLVDYLDKLILDNKKKLKEVKKLKQ